MKKVLSGVMAFLMLFSFAYAEDLGVQIIGGQQTTTSEPLSLDNIQMNGIYVLDGAIAVPQEFLVVDCFAQFRNNDDYSYSSDSYQQYNGRRSGSNPAIVFSYSSSKCENGSWRYNDAGWADSGDGYQFLWLRTDVTNTNSEIENLTPVITVKVVYADEYEFGGWIRQIDYSKISRNYSDGCVTRYGYEKDQHPAQIVMHPDKVEAVGPMQTGNYVFGCTLPNYVITDEETPLRMIIIIDGNEITYNIRK